MFDPGAAAGRNNRLDEMLLRSARFGEVQSKLDAILTAIRGAPTGGNAPTSVADAIVTHPDEAVPTPDELFLFLQAGRSQLPTERLRGTLDPDEIEPPVAPAQPKPVTFPAPEDPIVDRIARIEERLSGLSSLEASVCDLVSRFGTVQATHVEPIRQAALVEVRRALAVERAAADAIAPSALAAVEQVRGELATVKKEQGEEAKRLRTILQSLSASMERVAVRLEGLEEGISPVKQDAGFKEATIVQAPPQLKRPLPQAAMRRRRLLEAIGLSRRSAAFA